mmetsp:Transcript_7886/g.13968  ORF Transcript_7886/g.13968 Transcript_7886/m.13968 type:complete len:87 (-) Transcript_7886:44-304(-)
MSGVMAVGGTDCLASSHDANCASDEICLRIESTFHNGSLSSGLCAMVLNPRLQNVAFYRLVTSKYSQRSLFSTCSDFHSVYDGYFR